MIYTTKDGDMLDDICHRHYNRTSEAVEAILEANPGLADLGTIFDAGVEISLPELPATESIDTVRLWS